MCVIFHQDNARLHVSLKTWQKLLQLDLEILIHPPYSKGIDPLDFHLFQFLQNFLNGKNFHYLEDSTWNSSLLKKINCFRSIELWSCLKNGRRQWNKRINTLFRKVLGENEKKMCLLSKNWKKKTFWPTQYLIILKGNTFLWSLVLQVNGIVLKRIFSLLHTGQDLGSCLHDARNDSLPTFFEFTKSYFLLIEFIKSLHPAPS